MLSGIDFSFSAIMSGFIFGVIGLWLFREGKRRLNFRVMLTGIALMVVGYFTKGPFQDWGGGLALCGLAYWFWQEG